MKVENGYYYEGNYKAIGYFTAEDSEKMLQRSCISCKEKDPEFSLEKTIYGEGAPERAKRVAIVMNAWNYLGYIPAVGLVTGALKIALMGKVSKEYSDQDLTEENKVVRRAYTIRGIAEICGLGLLYAPMDAYTTLQRHRNPLQVEDPFARASAEVEDVPEAV